MNIKAVIFDLDGTITKPFLNFNAIRKEMGITTPEPILEAMEKMNDAERQEAHRILTRHEQAALEQSQLNAGADETLDKLRQAGIKIGVLTRNIRANAKIIEQKHNLKFDAIIDRNDGPVKPDGFGVKKLCEMFGVLPTEAIVVGDYLFDLLSARAAGAKSVLIKNHHKADEFVCEADFVIDKIPELLEII